MTIAVNKKDNSSQNQQIVVNGNNKRRKILRSLFKNKTKRKLIYFSKFIELNRICNNCKRHVSQYKQPYMIKMYDYFIVFD